MNRSLIALAVLLLATICSAPASAYVSCEAMHVVSMQSDCVVAGVLASVERDTLGRRVHGEGWLVVESVAFGAAPGDSLRLAWEYAAPPRGNGWGAIKSPADPDHGRREGQLSLWFLRRIDEGILGTTSMHCCVYGFGRRTDRVIGYLSGPPVIPKSVSLDWEADAWKATAVLEYLLSRKEEKQETD